MFRFTKDFLPIVFSFVTSLAVGLDPPDSQPKKIPQTRPEMKEALERLKRREARLPLPPATEEEIKAAEASGSSNLGGLVNNSRMRNRYLPEELRAGNFSRAKDPAMILDQTLAVELFWIASRVNNCHYCLGHQEVKLRSAGVTEDTLAALDCDWQRFTPREQAAFALAKKLTHEPHRLSDADFRGVSQHFTPSEILEIVFYVARYNSTNRWTDSLGIPQEEHRELTTPTSAEFERSPSVVALQAITERGPLPDWSSVHRMLEERKTSEPRHPLVIEEEARKRIGDLFPKNAPVPAWARLLCNFPTTGSAAAVAYHKVQLQGRLPAGLKSQIAWCAARHDRALYAMNLAAKGLFAAGFTQNEIAGLDHPESLDAKTRSAIELTVKLTIQPQAMTDADIAAVRNHFSEHETAEIVYHITQAAFLNRVTEAMRLPIETAR